MRAISRFNVSRSSCARFAPQRIFILNGRLCDLFHLTVQRYNIFIAVHEYFTRKYSFSHKKMCVAWSFGHLVICQNRKRTVKIRHYNINILFIYSEQWPRFRNRKWPNDLDQMTTLKKGLLCAIWQLEKHSSICLRKHMSDKKPSLAGMALKME